MKTATHTITSELWLRPEVRHDTQVEIEGARFLRDTLAMTPDDSLAACASVAVSLCSGRDGGVCVLSPTTGRLDHNLGGAPAPQDGLLRDCMASGKAMLIDRITSPSPGATAVIEEVLLVPFGIPGSRAAGVVWVVQDADAHSFDRLDACALEHVATFAASAAERGIAAIEAKGELASRDLSMDELTHRVENMLQVTARFLELQSTKMIAGEARTAIDSARNRILAIGTMHRLESNGEAASVVDALKEVCESVTCGDPRFRVRVLASEDFRMPGADVGRVAMIASELVTNAVKHASTGRDEVAIDVTLFKPAKDRVEVWVTDDGAPLKPDADKKGRRGLGLNLVHGLAKQLGGSFTVEAARKRFVLSFPLPRHPPAHRPDPDPRRRFADLASQPRMGLLP